MVAMGRNFFMSRTPSTGAELLNELNTIPETSSAFIRNSDGKLSGLISMIKYSINQAYCVAVEIDQLIIDKYISIEPTDDPQCFKIVNVQDTPQNMRLLPIFIQVHHAPKGRLPLEHLMDQIAEKTLGRLNLELKKNITVDLTDNDDIDVWRDKAGFIVTDKLYLCELIVSSAEFQKTLQLAKKTKISKFDASQMEKIVEFDKTLSNTNRSTFLEYLFKKANVITAENEETGAVEGYGVFRKDRILALYADSTEIAHAIMQKVLRIMNCEKVNLCTLQNCWSIEQTPGTRCTRIHRRHTRTVPGGIKWDRIFAVNVGMNLI